VTDTSGKEYKMSLKIEIQTPIGGGGGGLEIQHDIGVLDFGHKS